MGNLNIKGVLWGLGFWILGGLFFLAQGSICFPIERCNIDGYFIAGMIILGLLIPAWVVAAIASALTQKAPQQPQAPAAPASGGAQPPQQNA